MNLKRINDWSEAEARAEFLRCCGSTLWAIQMSARRPYADEAELFAAGEEAWQALSRGDWLEAFAAHPKIGDLDPLRRRFASTATWTAGEQAGVAAASQAVLQAIAECNRQYEAKFGFIFIVCATGKTADEMLFLLRQRLTNDSQEEFLIAVAEQAKITRLRLEKLCK